MIFCKYGCGKEATFQFKNGVWCCSNNTSKCPIVSKKIGKSNIGKSVGMKGKRHSKETREKLSKISKGRISPMKGKHLSEESKEKISKSKKGMPSPRKGNRLSKETREKLSKINKENPSRGMKGKHHSEESKIKMKESRKRNSSSGMKGKHHSDKTRKNMRLAYIKRLENIHGQIYPVYNPEGCKIIEEYGKQYGYSFQHAENGGEYRILGYFLDGYDKEKNVVIEIDEKHHFDINGNLKEKDIQRQKEIEEFLGCKFIRIRI